MISFIKRQFVTILLIVLLLSGLSLILYPTFSDIWNSYHQSEAIASYKRDVEIINQQEKDKQLSEAELYNKQLPIGVNPHLNLTKDEEERYNTTLDITGTGIMAYVEIPKLNTKLPIYHGTDEAVLEIAIGHIAGTSLPIGGVGTHSVISGHRGLPSAKLFTNLNELENGDTFMIHILDKTLIYEVDQSLTVLPEDLSALQIDPQKDYCTLVTCTPYGVNTHRLLVRGHRVFKEGLSESKDSVADSSFIRISLTIMLIIFAFALIFIYFRKKKYQQTYRRSKRGRR